MEITPNNIHIPDSYKTARKDILPICQVLKQYCEDMNYPVGQRTARSMANEWYAHNLLYKLGIARDRTKDVDLDYPQSKSLSALYALAGVAAWPFI